MADIHGENSQVARFLYEMGQLKNVTRSGWTMAGVQNAESVAEHSFRTALTAYLLARMTGADTQKVMVMALFHDMPETRIGDLHKVAQRYIDADKAQKQAAQDQAKSLPEELAQEIMAVTQEMEEKQSLEAKVVRDADLLECLFQAREYEDRGYPVTEWVKNCKAGLSTTEAQSIAEAAVTLSPRKWWEGLKIEE